MSTTNDPVQSQERMDQQRPLRLYRLQNLLDSMIFRMGGLTDEQTKGLEERFGEDALMGHYEPRITEVIRHSIFDRITLEKLSWSGRLDEPAFLSRMHDQEEPEK